MARFVLLTLVAVFALVAPAQARLVQDGTKPAVAFTAKATGGLTIVGTASELSIRDDGKTLLITVPLGRLTTGIALRDKHLREKYLHVGQYPSAELSVDRSLLKPLTSGAVSAEARGTMKIHGKTKALSVRYSAKKNGAAIQVMGSLRLDIRDFGIEVPSFLGVSVKPDVDIAVSFGAKDS